MNPPTLPIARLFFLLAFALAAPGCGEAPRPPVTAETYFDLKIDKTPFRAQVAVTPAEMAKGLMHRVALGENDGMLFVYSDEGRRSFWMKNTHIPLDIGFFSSDGTLREVRQMRPHDLEAVHSSGSDIRFALEMNRGWFERNGIAPGMKLAPDTLRAALEKRGVAGLPPLE